MRIVSACKTLNISEIKPLEREKQMSIYVQNILSERSGKPVANQFVINVEGVSLFQSYSTVIVRIERHGKVYLDRNNWNCSNKTSKYRNIFLNEDTDSTHRKIESGEYTLTNLNNSF
jgi:hypothetical protein